MGLWENKIYKTCIYINNPCYYLCNSYVRYIKINKNKLWNKVKKTG